MDFYHKLRIRTISSVILFFFFFSSSLQPGFAAEVVRSENETLKPVIRQDQMVTSKKAAVNPESLPSGSLMPEGPLSFQDKQNVSEARDENPVTLKAQYEHVNLEDALDEVRTDYAFAAVIDAKTVTADSLKKFASRDSEAALAVIEGELVLFSSGSRQHIRVATPAMELFNRALESKSAFMLHGHLNGEDVSPEDFDNAVRGGQEYVVSGDRIIAYNDDDVVNESVDTKIVLEHIQRALQDSEIKDATAARADLNRFIRQMDELNAGAESVEFRASQWTNTNPGIVNQTVTGPEDQNINFTLGPSSNAYLYGVPLIYVPVTAPSKGKVGIGGNQMVYIPNANTNGEDSMIVRATGDKNWKAPGQTVSQYQLLINRRNQLLSVGSRTPAQQEELGNVSAQAEAFNNIADAKITFRIAAVNDVPTANAQTLPIAQNVPQTLTLTGSDIDGNALTYSVVSQPASGKGTVSCNASGTCTYTPTANFTGTASFTFKANDGMADSAVQTVTLNVIAPSWTKTNPGIVNQTVNGTEDQNVTLTLGPSSDAYLYGVPLIYVPVTAPSKGKVGISGNQMVYIPNPNTNGEDSMIVRATGDKNWKAPGQTVSQYQLLVAARDQYLNIVSRTPAQQEILGNLIGQIAAFDNIAEFKVTFRITAVDDAPDVTYGPTAVVYQDRDWAINGNGFQAIDAEGDLVTWTLNTAHGKLTARADIPGGMTAANIVSGNGSKTIILKGPAALINATIAAGGLIYRGDSGYTGTDTMNVSITDGKLTANGQKIIDVKLVSPPFTAPDVVPDIRNFNGNEDQLVGNIILGPEKIAALYNIAVAYEIVQGPKKGKIAALAGNNAAYQPDPNVNGEDSFTYRIKAANTPANNTLKNNVQGRLNQISAMSGTLTPDVQAERNNLTAQLNLLNGEIDRGTVILNVAAVNDAPVAKAQTVFAAQNIQRTFNLTGSDVEGDALTFSVVNQPPAGKGTVSCSTSGACTYTPAANFTGTASFTFKANDRLADSAVQTVTFNVITPSWTHTNPGVSNQTANGTEDQTASLDFTLGPSNDNYLYGVPLRYIPVTAPSKGKVNITGNKLNYFADADAFGDDSMIIRATGDKEWKAPGETIPKYQMLLNRRDELQTMNSLTPAQQEELINLIVQIATFDNIAEATLSFHLAAVPDMPGIVRPPAFDIVPINQSTPIRGMSVVNVDEGLISIFLDSEEGMLTVNPDVLGGVSASTVRYYREQHAVGFGGTTEQINATLADPQGLIFTPNADYFGRAWIRVRLTTEYEYANTSIGFIIRGANHAPVAQAQRVFAPVNVQQKFMLSADDVDVDPLTFIVIDQPANGRGTVSCTSLGSCTYIPPANFTGSASFTFKANDGQADSAVQTVDLSVTYTDPNSFLPATLFLNFSGAFLPQWAGFSDLSLAAYAGPAAAIGNIAAAIAEKYSIFNVNVTTTDPFQRSETYSNAAEEANAKYDYYTRNRILEVVFTDTLSSALFGFASGGVALINSFISTIDVNSVFVFANDLKNGANRMWTAGAHEAGHAFGLEHQKLFINDHSYYEYNPGAGGVAPIMGNAYDKRALWWYGNAESATTYQDDIAVIAGKASNLFWLREDEAGNSPDSAIAFSDIFGTSFGAQGIINSSVDRDYYEFTTAEAGNVSFTASVAPYGAMLDLDLEIRDAEDRLITFASTENLGESISNFSLPAGKYYLVVKSRGQYDGDVGQYWIDGTVPLGTTTTAGPNAPW